MRPSSSFLPKAFVKPSESPGPPDVRVVPPASSNFAYSALACFRIEMLRE